VPSRPALRQLSKNASKSAAQRGAARARRIVNYTRSGVRALRTLRRGAAGALPSISFASCQLPS
jgi:hypothetical protein